LSQSIDARDLRARRARIAFAVAQTVLNPQAGDAVCQNAFRLIGANLSAVIPGPAIQVGLADLDGRSPESITPPFPAFARIAREAVPTSRGLFPAFAGTWVMDSGPRAKARAPE
jgi:hypothetical protein